MKATETQKTWWIFPHLPISRYQKAEPSWPWCTLPECNFVMWCTAAVMGHLTLNSHLQLMKAGLFPTTTKEPRTIFTFQVLDDFIWDNVKCRTSSMNYYTSKLQRNTFNAFPHLVPVGTLAIHDTTLIPFIGQILRATSSLQDVAVA